MPANLPPDRPTYFAQESPNTCAVACLRMVLSANGLAITESELARLARTNEFGTDLTHLVQAAVDLGFDCHAETSTLDGLREATFPIVYLDGPTLGRRFLMHAVVIAEINNVVRVLDPAQGEIDIGAELFRDAWETAGSYAVIVRRREGAQPD